MKCTSAEAAKLLRKLKSEHDALCALEKKSSAFIAAVGENVEEVRPEYAYDTVQADLAELERRMRVVKHALNIFNVTTVVPGFDMTVDQLLVYLPQLTERRNKLYRMASQLPRERMEAGGFGTKTIIEYSYANYDIAKAKADFDRADSELAAAQTALDVLNNSALLEFSLESNR